MPECKRCPCSSVNDVYEAYLFGVDATPDALAAVSEGRLAATISQSTGAQAVAAMDALVKLVNGEEVPEEIIVGHTLITKENVADFQ